MATIVVDYDTLGIPKCPTCRPIGDWELLVVASGTCAACCDEKGLAVRQRLLSNTLRHWSTVASNAGGTTTVVSGPSTMAGPRTWLPGRRSSHWWTGVST